MKFIFEWKKYFTSERSERVKSFFHKKINFISSNHRVIFFLLHRYQCFENKKKTRPKTKGKNRGMTSAISSLVRIWKIRHLYPGCSFIWKIRVVYISVKHSYLCNKKYVVVKQPDHFLQLKLLLALYKIFLSLLLMDLVIIINILVIIQTFK